MQDETSAGWRFNQSIGEDVVEEENKDADTISSVAFSPNGSYLAVGDKSGKIWIHQERQDKEVGKDFVFFV
jgi:hypothetical protein